MLELKIVKDHCRVDHTLDDDLFKVYISAAVRYVENRTDRVLLAEPADDVDALILDSDIITAMLLMIGHWYENREAVNVGNITSVMPLAVDALLQPHRYYGA